MDTATVARADASAGAAAAASASGSEAAADSATFSPTSMDLDAAPEVDCHVGSGRTQACGDTNVDTAPVRLAPRHLHGRCHDIMCRFALWVRSAMSLIQPLVMHAFVRARHTVLHMQQLCMDDEGCLVKGHNDSGAEARALARALTASVFSSVLRKHSPQVAAGAAAADASMPMRAQLAPTTVPIVSKNSDQGKRKLSKAEKLRKQLHVGAGNCIDQTESVAAKRRRLNSGATSC